MVSREAAKPPGSAKTKKEREMRQSIRVNLAYEMAADEIRILRDRARALELRADEAELMAREKHPGEFADLARLEAGGFERDADYLRQSILAKSALARTADTLRGMANRAKKYADEVAAINGFVEVSA